MTNRTTAADVRRLSSSAAKLLAEMAEAEYAVGDDRRAELLEMLLDWHRPVEGTPIEVIARRYAHAIACMRLVTTQKAEAPISLDLPEGFEGADDLDLNRTAVFEVLRMIGSDDPEAWASLLVLLLALRGDRFLEVCDGRL